MLRAKFGFSPASGLAQAGLGMALLVACSSTDAAPSASNGAAGNGASAGAAGMPSGGTSAAGSAGAPTGAGTSSGGQAGASAGGASGAAAGAAGGAGGAAGGSAGALGGAGGSGGAAGPFELSSTAWKEGEEIPLKYKCAEVNPVGQNMSPPLGWGPGPAGTKSYAIVMMHLPSPEHWVIWDIPASATSLPENIEHQAQPAQPAGSKQSQVDLDGFQGSGYLGPCPQAFDSAQTYRFTLYALDVETVPGITTASSPPQAAAAVKQHLVQGSQGVSLSGTQIRTQ